jgi:CheY-like chemotaxis protein
MEVMPGALGRSLIKANSGTEALEFLFKTDVAIILMDVSMPEVDGFELAETDRAKISPRQRSAFDDHG